MNKYKFLYVIWLLPAYLLFLCVHQGMVFYSVVDTYDSGTSYNAEVVEFNMKKIAAQTNSYVILEFETKDGEQHQQKLAIPIEMASAVNKSQIVPIRYKEGAFVNIVIISSFSTQKGLILTNMGMAFVGLMIALFVAYLMHRYVRRKLSGDDESFIIERIDNDSE